MQVGLINYQTEYVIEICGETQYTNYEVLSQFTCLELLHETTHIYPLLKWQGRIQMKINMPYLQFYSFSNVTSLHRQILFVLRDSKKTLLTKLMKTEKLENVTFFIDFSCSLSWVLSFAFPFASFSFSFSFLDDCK